MRAIGCWLVLTPRRWPAPAAIDLLLDLVLEMGKRKRWRRDGWVSSHAACDVWDNFDRLLVMIAGSAGAGGSMEYVGCALLSGGIFRGARRRWDIFDVI